MDYQNATSSLCSTSFNTETNVYQKTLPFSIGNLTEITTINLNRIYDLANWPHRKLWVEVNARVNYIKELLTQHLSNDVSEIVVSYAYFNPNVYKLTVKQNQETDEMHRTLEQNHNVGEANNNPSTR